MSIDQAIIYFLSGTGNSYRVARWIAEAAQDAGAAVQTRPIQSAQPEAELGQGSPSLVGLVFPTHGFTVPWAMLRFALRLPRRRSMPAVIIATRASIRVGRFFVPGLEGTGPYLLSLILTLKGYRVRGVMAVDMPSNWLALHPGLGPDTIAAIIERARIKVAGFIQPILAGGRCFSGWVGLFFGLLILPVSFAYVMAGRFYFAKLFFASDDCNQCEQCARNCPVGAIKMWGRGEKRRPYWTLDCENCMRCMAYCPTQAIEAGHSWALILVVVTSIPVAAMLLNSLVARFPALARLNNQVLTLLIEYLYMLASLSLAYRLFSLLLRVSWINRLFTVTTLTHYYRRYNEPETELRDLELGGKNDQG